MKPIILLTSRATQDLRTEAHQYTLRTNYCRAIEQAGGVPVIAAWSNAVEYAATASGLLLTGGADIAPSFYGEEQRLCHGVDLERDRSELALFEAFSDKGKPIMGICRGAQLINVALGGTLHQDLKQEFEALPHHSKIFEGESHSHPVMATPGSTLASLFGEEFSTNSFHHQAIKDCGAGLVVTAATEEGVVEAVEHQTLPILAVQWHPERMIGEENTDLPDMLPLFRHFVELCKK